MTTSSEIITGCDVTASTTTAGDYCPAPTSINPETDDEGDDETGTTDDVKVVTVTTTLSETVLINLTPYAVGPGGQVVIAGDTYTVPAVTTVEETTVGGQPATLLPPLVGPSLSITASGISVSTASTTSVVSTTPPPTTPAPSPTLGVWGYGVLAVVPQGGIYYGQEDWWTEEDFISGVVNTASCNALESNTLAQPVSLVYSNYPSSWAFTTAIHGYSSCTYLNPAAPSAGVGTLTCPDMPTQVACPTVTATATGSCVDSNNNGLNYKTIFYCLF
jgi:hypothetical protein